MSDDLIRGHIVLLQYFIVLGPLIIFTSCFENGFCPTVCSTTFFYNSCKSIDSTWKPHEAHTAAVRYRCSSGKSCSQKKFSPLNAPLGKFLWVLSTITTKLLSSTFTPYSIWRLGFEDTYPKFKIQQNTPLCYIYFIGFRVRYSFTIKYSINIQIIELDFSWSSRNGTKLTLFQSLPRFLNE